MLKSLSEYGKWIYIVGYKNFKLKDAKSFLNKIREIIGSSVDVQFFNADLVATWQHLYFATLNAVMAMQTKRNISKSLAVEVLLYASAQRQISKAIELIGVNHDCTNIAAVIIGENDESVKKAYSIISNFLKFEENMDVFGTSDSKNSEIRKIFGITDEELKASYKADKSADPLVLAVLERIALLSTQI